MNQVILLCFFYVSCYNFSFSLFVSHVYLEINSLSLHPSAQKHIFHTLSLWLKCVLAEMEM